MACAVCAAGRRSCLPLKQMRSCSLPERRAAARPPRWGWAAKHHLSQHLALFTRPGRCTWCLHVDAVVWLATETGGLSGAWFMSADRLCRRPQVPQMILEEAWGAARGARIMCTQPRRISAVSVAERIAQERGEKIGDSVGYTIRLESK